MTASSINETIFMESRISGTSTDRLRKRTLSGPPRSCGIFDETAYPVPAYQVSAPSSDSSFPEGPASCWSTSHSTLSDARLYWECARNFGRKNPDSLILIIRPLANLLSKIVAPNIMKRQQAYERNFPLLPKLFLSINIYRRVVNG